MPEIPELVMPEIPELFYDDDDDDDEMEIVVHTVQRGKIPNMKGKYQFYGELYTVNLNSGIVSKCGIGKLIMDDETTAMVALDHSIYILGGYVYKTSLIGKRNAIVAKDEHHHFHSKASTIDIGVDNKKGKGWKAIPHFQSLHHSPNSLSFNGKIYQFCGTSVDPDRRGAGEVFDPKTGKWDLLLPPPCHDADADADAVYWGYYVSYPSLADLDNNRIIVHSSKYNSIYAYYPDQSRWECLVSDFGTWHHPLVVLHDGLLLFHVPDHPSCFMAFDLHARRYLNPVISNFNSHFRFPGYLALFPLKPPGTFCFASHATEIDHPITCLTFVKFRVERISQGGGDPLITFISRQTFDIACKCDFSSYVPLEPLLNPLFKFKTAARELGSCTTLVRDS